MNKTLEFIEKNSQKLLWVGICIYALVFSIISIWKLNGYLYNGLDLAIFNNVFYNTLHGNWFWSSVQGHSYLGDHFAPILFLLLPIYAIWQAPETLLIIQSVFLGLAAWPIYMISRLVMDDKKMALGISVLWLINPLVHNINLFEFHLVALAPVVILFLFYNLLKINQGRKYVVGFWIWLILCLMIREDIACIILILLIIGLFKNRKIAGWGLLVTIGWMVAAGKIISYFSLFNVSPFIYYYQWLGNVDMGRVMGHLVNIPNFEMMVGWLLPFLFIPLIKPKWLLIALIPLGQIMLSATGGGALIWQMHYGVMFLPAIVLAFIYGFKKSNDFVEAKLKSKYLLLIILVVANVFLWKDIGPFKLNNPVLAEEFKIEGEGAMMGSYRFLANYSSRENIYSLHYYFLNQQQFGLGEYILESEPEYMLVDFDDLVSFSIHLAYLDWSKVGYINGDKRLRELFKNYGVAEVKNGVVLFKKGHESEIDLYGIKRDEGKEGKYEFEGKIELVDYELNEEAGKLRLTFRALENLDKDYQLRINKKILPMAWGLYPTSEWQDGEIVEMNYWLDNIKEINLGLIEIYGGMEIGKMGVIKRVIDKEVLVGEEVLIN